MKILLKEVTVISPGSKHHMKKCDLLVDNGLIAKIAESGGITSGADQVISGKNYFVSSGWFDVHVNFREPGMEYKEDLTSGSEAAARGGFTGVLLMPSTEPALSSRPAIEFIRKKTEGQLVDVIPAGSLSVNREGKDLSEMFDMAQAGTKVFTDDKRSVQDSGLMTRALQYAGNFGGKIFSYPEDKSISGKAQIHESSNSVLLGLKGIPAIAEEVMVNRDLYLAAYTDSPIHFSTISTAGSVDLIRKAKARGMKITSDVSSVHLMFDDSVLQEFDSVYKVKPPLRSASDVESLKAGLKDGTIDCITSDHSPEDTENKKKEFEHAAYGCSNLETAFAAARTATKDVLSVPELIAKFTTQARACAGLKNELIEEGREANLTVFDPDAEWVVEEKSLRSKSKNNPFIGKKLSGRAIAVLNHDKLQLIK